MNLAFLLHIYQPSIQDEKVLNRVVDECYKPLIRTIKNLQNLKVTINMPLSLIYQLDTLGHKDIIKSLKDLYDADRIEFTSCAAYHPLLTKLPWEIAQKEIILNEYGLSYYFGKHKGFEGEDALLIKNLNGFFPPEMAVDQDLIKNLDSLGYQWVIVDEPALRDSQHYKDNYVFAVDNLNIKVVRRNKEISNLISFKRDYNIDDLIEKILILRQSGKDLALAFDGEVLGHHNKDGVFMFESLITALEKLQIGTCTISELVENADFVKIEAIKKSTWGISPEDYFTDNIYTLWDNDGNKLQELLWGVFDEFVAYYQKNVESYVSTKGSDLVLETFPVWDSGYLDKITNIELKNKIYQEILFLQSLNSDQFWWASQKYVGDKLIYDKNYIYKCLEIYKHLAMIWQDDTLYNFVDQKSKEIDKINS